MLQDVSYEVIESEVYRDLEIAFLWRLACEYTEFRPSTWSEMLAHVEDCEP